MSYIIKSTNPFASTKITEKGREKLAKGQLTFSSWAIGDSEINYIREELLDAELISGDTRVIRPKDRHPNIKYFIAKNDGSTLQPFGVDDVKCIKAVISNEADERGHFTGSTASGWTTNTSLTGYTRSSGTITSAVVNGGTTIDITSNNAEVGDFLLLKLAYSDFTNETPTPHLWYKIQVSGATTLTVDRDLPSLSSGNVQYIIYKGGEIYDNEPDAISYWDTGTLSFDSSCDITVLDVPIFNMSNVFSEDILGVSGITYQDHTEYGSYNYLGQKDNFLYDPANGTNKAISIIHYTNKTISNLYGEFFFIDNDGKNVKVHLPDLMYHRRTFTGGTTNGDKMGMSFVASGATTFIGSNGQNYIPLIEDETFINGAPISVGRVYPDLKIIVFDDPEIVAATSYKSNRNWTLPKLNLTLTNPSGGVGTGVLSANETIYVTYAVDNESGTGIAPALPNQNYSTITNTSASSLDVQFNMETVDLLPYMRNDDTTSDGFYGDTFKVIYQITTSGERPVSGSWSVLDFTTSVDSGGFVNPGLLEVQNPLAATPILQLTQANDATASAYSLISTLNMPLSSAPDNLQFGDERFFYGNVEANIGATIFKTLFKVSIHASDFSITNNITRSSEPATNPPVIKVSEVGIYDNDGDLVITSKLSNPIKLTSGNTIIIELSMDF
tara:strand:- start:2214 stop:4226 length:2013 start_codon:yes stop_codon:yes gene_type:complete